MTNENTSYIYIWRYWYIHIYNYICICTNIYIYIFIIIYIVYTYTCTHCGDVHLHTFIETCIHPCIHIPTHKPTYLPIYLLITLHNIKYYDIHTYINVSHLRPSQASNHTFKWVSTTVRRIVCILYPLITTNFVVVKHDFFRSKWVVPWLLPVPPVGFLHNVWFLLLLQSETTSGYAGNQETTHFQTHRIHVTGRFTYIYHKNQPFM